MNLRCESTSCHEDPFCDCQWGSDSLPVQTLTLCKKHMDELWKMLNPLLQRNTAWFRIDRAGEIKNEHLTDKTDSISLDSIGGDGG